jgi:hypothetical protein
MPLCILYRNAKVNHTAIGRLIVGSQLKPHALVTIRCSAQVDAAHSFDSQQANLMCNFKKANLKSNVIKMNGGTILPGFM